MKCKCGVAFCWLCGKQIEDTVFPAHFQWWNPAGCTNLQLNESVAPSLCIRIVARVVAVIQMIIFGPITIVSVIVSSLLCLPCMFCKLKHDKPPSLRTYIQEGAGNCLSGWGMFWMVVMTVLPLVLAFGGAIAGICIAVVAALYPCYFVYRVSRRRIPLPSAVTNYFWHNCCSPIAMRFRQWQAERQRRQAEKSETQPSTSSGTEEHSIEIFDEELGNVGNKDEEEKENSLNETTSISVDMESPDVEDEDSSRKHVHFEFDEDRMDQNKEEPLALPIDDVINEATKADHMM